jgi:hypothetical protein
VLHDIENAAVKRLPKLLDALGEQGVEIVQSFPEEVVLIREGQRRPARVGFVAVRKAGQANVIWEGTGIRKGSFDDNCNGPQLLRQPGRPVS